MIYFSKNTVEPSGLQYVGEFHLVIYILPDVIFAKKTVSHKSPNSKQKPENV
jgi:hypothetical protein